MRRQTLLALGLLALPLGLLADPVEEKGFVYAAGKLRAEPKADSAETAAPPGGARLLYRKVIREGEAVAWYWVDQPGLGKGWLAGSESSKDRAVPLPDVKAVKRVTAAAVPAPGDKNANATAAAIATRGLAGGSRFAQETSAHTSASDGLAERALSSRAKSSAEANEIVDRAAIDWITLERVIGIEMSDPPHPDGRYADVTARGRKADAEKWTKTVSEGD